MYHSSSRGFGKQRHQSLPSPSCRDPFHGWTQTTKAILRSVLAPYRKTWVERSLGAHALMLLCPSDLLRACAYFIAYNSKPSPWPLPTAHECALIASTFSEGGLDAFNGVDMSQPTWRVDLPSGGGVVETRHVKHFLTWQRTALGRGSYLRSLNVTFADVAYFARHPDVFGRWLFMHFTPEEYTTIVALFNKLTWENRLRKTTRKYIPFNRTLYGLNNAANPVNAYLRRATVEMKCTEFPPSHGINRIVKLFAADPQCYVEMTCFHSYISSPGVTKGAACINVLQRTKEILLRQISAIDVHVKAFLKKGIWCLPHDVLADSCWIVCPSNRDDHRARLRADVVSSLHRRLACVREILKYFHRHVRPLQQDNPTPSPPTDHATPPPPVVPPVPVVSHRCGLGDACTDGQCTGAICQGEETIWFECSAGCHLRFHKSCWRKYAGRGFRWTADQSTSCLACGEGLVLAAGGPKGRVHRFTPPGSCGLSSSSDVPEDVDVEVYDDDVEEEEEEESEEEVLGGEEEVPEEPEPAREVPDDVCLRPLIRTKDAVVDKSVRKSPKKRKPFKKFVLHIDEFQQLQF